MKLAMMLNYAGGFKESVDQVVELEKAGLDQVWVPEAYSFDAISQVGYLAARTERVEIATGILNVYSRTAALMAMTAAPVSMSMRFGRNQTVPLDTETPSSARRLTSPRSPTS